MLKRTIRLAAFGLIAVATLAACSGHHPKATYGRVYKDPDGRYYTRSYYDGSFQYWTYSVPSPCGSCSSLPDGGSWNVSVDIPPSSKPTSQVVRDTAGKPAVKSEEEEEVEADEVVDESTTASPDTDSSSDDGSDGGSGSSESGDSGGSDSGGGDGGGD